MSFLKHGLRRRLQWLNIVVRTSLAEQERDFTRGPINTAVILLDIQMMLELLME